MPNIPISSLPITTTVNPIALVPIVQNGVTFSTYSCLLGSGGGGIGGNITCLQAGCNVTISPSCGTGVVTVSSIGGCGGINCVQAGCNVIVSPSCGTGVVTISSIGGCFGISCIQAGCNVTVNPSCGVGVVTISSTGGGIGGNVTCLVAGSNVIISPSCGIGVVTVSTTGGCCSCISFVNSITAGLGININPSCGCGDVTICSTAIDTPMQRANGILSIVGNTNLNSGCAAYTFIGNGVNNCTSICGSYSVIGNGTCNIVSSAFSAIMGGACNNLSGQGYLGVFGCGLNACTNCNSIFYVNNLCVCGCISMTNSINPNCQICVGADGQLVGFTGIGAAGVLCCSGTNSTIRINASNTATGCNSFVVGTCNTSSGNSSSILGGNLNNDCGLNNVAIIGLSNFNAPCECTTYVNQLCVKPFCNQSGFICVSACKTLLLAPSLFIYDNSIGCCSVGRPNTGGCAFGNYSASFIRGFVYGDFSTSFGCGQLFPYAVCGLNSYTGAALSSLCGNCSFIGAGICHSSFGNYNTNLSGYFNRTCGCFNSSGGGGFNQVTGNSNTLVGGYLNLNLDCNNFIGGGSQNCIGICGYNLYNNNTILGGRCVQITNYCQTSNNSSLSGYRNTTNGNFGVSMNGSEMAITGNYSYRVFGTFQSRLCPANFNTSLIGYCQNQYCDYNFSAIHLSQSLNSEYSTSIISYNTSVSSAFGFLAIGDNCFGNVGGVAYNTIINGSGNCTLRGNSEVTSGTNNFSFCDYATITNGCGSFTDSCFSLIHGNSNTACSAASYAFIVGSCNCMSGVVPSNFTGVFGCGLCNTTSCSFMSNSLVACNIFGAASLCANANGIISPVVSDIRIKCNILPIEYGIKEVKKLNPISYNWSEAYKEVKGLTRKIGFIAQEVEKIIPEAVSIKNESYIFDDKALVPIYIKSIQQISKRISILNQKLDSAIEKK